MLVVSVEGITDRDAAAALTGLELSIPRDRLPDPDDEDFYHADLIGLHVETPSGEPIGSVVAIYNHGARRRLGDRCFRRRANPRSVHEGCRSNRRHCRRPARRRIRRQGFSTATKTRRSVSENQRPWAATILTL